MSQLGDAGPESRRARGMLGGTDVDGTFHIVIASPRIGGQQNLRALELARGVLTSAHKRGERGVLGLAQFNPIAYIHLCLLFIRGTDEQLNRMADVSRAGKNFTPKQGQYLAFIHLYTRLHRRPPAETDMQEYFRVSPPSVHQMVLTLERAGTSGDSRASPAVSKCSLIRNACQSYFDPGFNLSKSLCSGTRRRRKYWVGLGVGVGGVGGGGGGLGGGQKLVVHLLGIVHTSCGKR